MNDFAPGEKLHGCRSASFLPDSDAAHGPDALLPFAPMFVINVRACNKLFRAKRSTFHGYVNGKPCQPKRSKR